jgi:hypothetical protein
LRMADGGPDIQTTLGDGAGSELRSTGRECVMVRARGRE